MHSLTVEREPYFPRTQETNFEWLLECLMLYLIYKQSVNSMIYNLSILLSNDILQSTEAEITLPSEDELASIIRANCDLIPISSDLRVNKGHAVVWNVVGNIRWFIRFCIRQ